MVAKPIAVKALYLILYAPAEFLLPFLRQLVLGVVPQGRPLPKWTLRQAVMVRLIKSFLRVSAFLQPQLPSSLQQGAEGDRFALILPADDDFYIGPMADPDVRPTSTGGTWTPKPATRARTQDLAGLRVALHFHGGAYVIGDGRDHDTGFTADVLLKNAGFTHVFTPQYRLANTPADRFPAQLQDALSSYLYLTRKLGIPPECIAVGGDSAGGNLALALLRYIHEYGEELDIAPPSSALLWSPWTDVSGAVSEEHVRSSPRFHTDYLAEAFPIWGSHNLTDNGKIDVRDPYISHLPGHEYKSEVPMWVHTGGAEVLGTENEEFVKAYRAAGSEVEWRVDDNCPHDMILLGKFLGFEDVTRKAGEAAGDFVRRHGLAVTNGHA